MPSAKRPYLLRAYYDWIVDNDFTPFLLVDATYPDVDVPTEYVQNGQIVLNISMRATGNLSLTNDSVQFDARFQGQTRHIYVPMGAVLAIYARENSEGVMFEAEENFEKAKETTKEDATNFLKIVK